MTENSSASSKGACFTWLFTAMAEPGRTLTEWQCRSTGGFGILVDNPETSTTLAQSQTASSTQKGDPVMDPPDADARTPVGAIIGGVIGSLAVISLGVIGSLLVLRRRQQTAQTFIGGGNRPGLGTAHSQVPLSGYGPHERYMPISTSSGYSPSSSQKYRDMEMNPPYSIELDATPTSHIVELDGTLAIGGHDNRAELKA